ncbi:putative DNA helicase chromatin remodeling SNF2 family [Helianthus annuus]|uniref:DNA helicase chromatin remodeling SNF2 family n=1 Tax=Helianthus annuus TaxID=4232 RepID=A0A251U0I3_HELAN|nr:helicase-like transcription factor CHR28 [Helianthus annuus]KAF5765014.1 putative DNA helicase chromatin remodeling SNF2 family [Helianthus annuus]KAJ0451613.1 putative DNA helicase chromatin remodeling SNF2 family [Helianthus annuus]KAJ0473489.1 putative DNA helicase chromatin remodeling SNF2 family [Helianthus annuus]KAJ0649074.1 putative DNA helicase chromatin remodeling SNF2 family [Helianthus annuus]KAJ0652865.1 putative DNA helicase chromatin remodeling SNF2 family [Helianthus annuus]
MIMANGSPPYEWRFDDDDDGFDVTAMEDEPLDFESMFNSIGEQSRGDFSENLPADPPSNMAPCNESASHEANEHCEPHNGSLALPFLHHSEASTSMAYYPDASFDTSADCSMSVPAQDFSSFYNHGTGTNFERAHINDTFGFTNGSDGNHQLMDTTGISDGMFYDMGGPLMNLFGGYSDGFYDPHHEFSMPCITGSNEPLYFGSSNSNHNDGMLFNVNMESEEHLMQNLSRNNAVNDIGPHVCAEGSKVENESTSGYHGLRMCHMSNKKQSVHAKDDKHVPTLGPACKKESLANGKPRKIRREKAKLETNDEKSGYQFPSQEFPHQKSELSLPDNGLAVPLLKHQRIALSWMSKRETKSTRCCGGILADDQGLGKTISAIALILKERSPPSSSLSAIETKDKAIETLCLDEDEHTKPSVPTTSNRVSAGTLVVCPTSVLRQWNEELQNKVVTEANLSVLVYYGINRTKDPIELAKYDVVITTYAIVSMEVPKQPLDEDDEATIKISSTKKRKYPPTDSAECPLAKLRWFRVVLDEAQSIKNYKTQAARACWGLRAKRRWCLSGTPIQNSIDDLYSYFRFLKYDPFAVYKKFCTQIKAPIQRNPKDGYKMLQVILKTIMLRRTKGTLLKGEPIISLPPKTVILKKVDFSAEERGFYRSLEAEARAQFEEYAAAGTVKQNYVNILLMLLRLRQACDHPLLVRGCRSSTDWRLSVEKAKQLPQEKLKHLLNCLEASLAICSICNDPPEDAVVTTCEHVFCNQCILEHLSTDDNQCPSSECKKLLNKSSVFCKSALTVSVMDRDSVESEVTEPCSTNEPVDSLKIEAAKALDSSKIRAAIEVLQTIAKPKDITVTVNDTKTEGNSVVREKAIVFSQWTGMLDLLEVCLKDSSIGYRRLDGTMSVVARDKAVKDFNKLPEVTVIIMSLKAASLGLNMVAACHVILLDLWWNPTIEDQAIDRAHRIGQTRPVTVLRLAVKDTIEDRILALQKKKREMVASAFGDDKNGCLQTRLTFADIRYLFQA